MNNAIDEIKKKIDIIDLIGSFITLRKAGRNFKAICPFHQEKTPSFVVSPERQIWHCFGSCNEGGDIIKFLMKWENITFFEALKELAEKAGVKLSTVGFEDQAWKKKERLIQINNLAGEYFNYILFKTKFGDKALSYLKSRSINQQIAKKFQLGYSPSSWDSLLNFLSKKKFMPEEIYEAGITVKSEKGGFYDRFRGRLMFPIKDARANTIGFAGRNLDDQAKEAKYINTPETPIYHKRESLYGIDLAKDAIKKAKNVIFVEGEFDVISPYQYGIENVVAIKGSALTRDQLMLIKRYTDRITFALDADSTGEEAIKRAVEEAEPFDFAIQIMLLDFAKDPDEAVRKDPTKFKKTVAKAIPVYDFLINHAQKKYPGEDPFDKRKIGDEVIPAIDKIRNPIVQSHYIKKLAAVLDVSETSINAMLRRLKQKQDQNQVFRSKLKSPTQESREVNIQKYVLSILFQNKEPYKLSEQFFNIVATDDFSVLSLQKIINSFFKYKKKYSQTFEVKKFTKQLSQELQPVFDELYLYASYNEDFKQENLDKLLYEIKKYSLKRKIGETISGQNGSNPNQEESLKMMSSMLKEVEKKMLGL